MTDWFKNDFVPRTRFILDTEWKQINRIKHFETLQNVGYFQNDATSIRIDSICFQSISESVHVCFINQSQAKIYHNWSSRHRPSMAYKTMFLTVNGESNQNRKTLTRTHTHTSDKRHHWNVLLIRKLNEHTNSNKHKIKYKNSKKINVNNNRS